VVTVCTARFSIHKFYVLPTSVFMRFVWISEQTAIVSLYSINWLVFITKTECVYCAVRTLCTTRFNTHKFYVLPTQCVYVFFVWISEQTAIVSLYSINWVVFTTETESVYCAVRTVSLNMIQVNFVFKGLGISLSSVILSYWYGLMQTD
jgi:hypothetical protein